MRLVASLAASASEATANRVAFAKGYELKKTSLPYPALKLNPPPLLLPAPGASG